MHELVKELLRGNFDAVSEIDKEKIPLVILGFSKTANEEMKEKLWDYLLQNGLLGIVAIRMLELGHHDLAKEIAANRVARDDLLAVTHYLLGNYDLVEECVDEEDEIIWRILRSIEAGRSGNMDPRKILFKYGVVGDFIDGSISYDFMETLTFILSLSPEMKEARFLLNVINGKVNREEFRKLLEEDRENFDIATVFLYVNSRVAEELYMEALEYFKEIGDKEGILKTALELDRLGDVCYYYLKQYDRAFNCYEKSLKIKEEFGDKEKIAEASYRIGCAYYFRGQYDKALEYFKKSLKIYEHLEDKAGIAKALHHIGIIHAERGEYDRALECHGKSLKIYRDLENKVGIIVALLSIGNVYEKRGEYDKALKYYERSLKISEEIGYEKGVAESLHWIGNIYFSRGQYDKALEYYEESLKISEEIGGIESIATTLLQIGIVHEKRGEYDKALRCYKEVLKIHRGIRERSLMIFEEMEYEWVNTALQRIKKISDLLGDRD